ncbi:glycoside hydrolase family 31 protein [Sphingobium lactosutens]|uniref:Alpha-xylosidase n=1 Tax=Sphingobium lactosutens DS20 TaxID=1331060 RepID=T0IM54_9SPHN|nr:TIM-barrel domain-containing protein [Sphingobium lactosutens]EQB12825.1 alpha-xylosidase [Sphingobium lactosutens DS20]
MKFLFMLASVSTTALSMPVQAQGDPYARIDGGVAITPAKGDAARVEVTVHGDRIFHVVAIPRAMVKKPRAPSLMAPDPPAAGPYSVTAKGHHVLVKAAQATADIDIDTGSVRFLDPAGAPILSEARAVAFAPATAGGETFVTVSQQFNRGTDEGLYGLGQHQNAQMNHNGADVELAQHNMDIAVPFLVSTRGYGLLWDNNSITRFGNPKPYTLVGEGMTVTSGGQPGWQADYYLDGKRVVSRREGSINYQYIRDLKRWPEAATAKTVAATGGQNTAGNAAQKQKVVWSGDIHPTASGVHKFQLYGSSYFKVFVDGKLVLDRWRQNWNPWYANFDVPLTAGKPAQVRIEWEPNAGYMAFFHSDPLPQPDRHSIWFTSEVGQAKNYWFIAGGGIEGSIAGYRQLTGKAQMLPKWAYGFWQSRQRYDTAKELTDVVAEYRKRHIPLDNIVLDWRYWRDAEWGSHVFDPARFPDPKAMVDAAHADHANVMISVWPKFYPTTQNYKELAQAGAIYQGNLRQGNKDWVGPGYASTFYDPYSAKGRQIFWSQIERQLADLGIDAWWADASEPDMHSNLSIEERIDTMGPTAIGPAAQYFNSYPLMNARAFYEGWTQYKPDVRPFLLTRSGFGGLQRYGAAIWSGDVASRWFDLRAQISAGVNASMSGLPNWTHDIGGFALEDRYSAEKPAAADLDEWRELNLRWFQFGAFSPLFRSHGEFPYREIYEISPEGSPMRSSMVWYDELRYRLMPYIYTLAADTYMRDGSIIKAMAALYPQDVAARDINDEYMFGDAFLVAPVTQYRARSRHVYFPGQAIWYDFTTGQSYRGGTNAQVSAPFERMPVFVRAGAIIPMGPVTQYVNEKRDAPLTLAIYPGADGEFSLYEDDGRSEQYKNGYFSRIAIRYDDKNGRVSLGQREGKAWQDMPESRTIRVKWVKPGTGIGDEQDFDAQVRYTGAAITVERP